MKSAWRILCVTGVNEGLIKEISSRGDGHKDGGGNWDELGSSRAVPQHRYWLYKNGSLIFRSNSSSYLKERCHLGAAGMKDWRLGILSADQYKAITHSLHCDQMSSYLHRMKHECLCKRCLCSFYSIFFPLRFIFLSLKQVREETVEVPPVCRLFVWKVSSRQP